MIVRLELILMTRDSSTAPRSWIIVLVVMMAATGSSCLNWGVEEPEGDAGVDADVDGDVDIDGDLETDEDADTDGDADADSDLDRDLDVELDSDGGDADLDADIDQTSDAEADEEVDSDRDQDAEADSDTDGDEDVDEILPFDPVVGDAVMLYEGFVHAGFGQAAVAAYAPGCYFVTWSNTAYAEDTAQDVVGLRVCATGATATIVDDSPVSITSTDAPESLQSMACHSGECLVLFSANPDGEESGDLWGARVRLDPGPIEVLDPAGFPISRASDLQRSSQVAFDGTNYIAVWWDYRSGSTYDIYGARVTTEGVVLDADETIGAIRVSSPPPAVVYPDIACVTSQCLVAWGTFEDEPETRNIVGAFLTTDGADADVFPSFSISTADQAQDFGSLASDGRDFLAVWYDARTALTDYDIYASRVRASDGAVLDDPEDGIAVTTAVDQQRHPSIAFDGSNYLIVWHSYADSGDVYTRWMGRSGEFLSGGMPVAVGPALDSARKHAIVSAASGEFLIVYRHQETEEDPWQIMARVVRSHGGE